MINPALDQKFPSVMDMEKAALRRMPRFVADYVRCGMGQGAGLRHNRDSLDRVKLLPKYLVEADTVNIASKFLNMDYAAPFGVAPVGLGGIAWPGAAEALAQSANRHQIPFSTTTFAVSSLESLRNSAGEFGWMQYYHPNRPEIATDLLSRASACGYDVLLLTVDMPAATRRPHDIRNGLSIPPRISPDLLWQLATHPQWTIAMAKQLFKRGMPRFKSFDPYIPNHLSQTEALAFLSELTIGQISTTVMQEVRDQWPGKLIVKGVLLPDEACLYRDLGADAILVSNHGGRQLEAAPSAIQMLPAMRQALGPDFPILADGAIRSGIDICRMLASGADFVLLGRAFYYAVAAMGLNGADHVMKVLQEELKCVLGQLGCVEINELADRLYRN
jgi:isopentenyl diphosphate isomerase/L-lactate dehydrogenase-like FMN-dependent dehydrogenase